MRKLATLTAIAAIVGLGYGSDVKADPYADAVESFTPPTNCKTPSVDPLINDCDISGDDEDGGTDALGANDGNVADNTTFTSLGFTTDVDGDPTNGLQPQGGVLILNFTDNFCVDGLNPDFTVFEVAGVNEPYDVTVGPGAGTAAGGGLGDTNFNSPVAAFNRITMTATDGEETNPTGGPDIDAVECLATFDHADIEKEFAPHPDDPDADPDGIRQTSSDGFDDQQFKAFTITIANNTGVDGGLAGLIFFDSVPAEFDLDPVADDDDGTADGVKVTDEPAAGDCTATGVEHQSQGQGNKLKPEHITITADGLNDGESCTVTVWVQTDDDHPGKGKNPEWTPTSCPVVLNDAVKVFDASFNLLLQDDSSLIFDNGGARADSSGNDGFCNPAP